MQTRKLRNLTFALVTAFIAAAIVAPTVSAQNAETSLTLATPSVSYSSGSAIVPDAGSAKVSVPWVYEIKSSGFELAGLATSGTTLNFDPPTCDNNQIIVTGSNSYPVTVAGDAGEPPARRVTGTAEFIVTASSLAPGEINVKCTFVGEVEALQGQQVPATGKKSTSVPVVVQYLGLLSTNIPKTIAQAAPQKEIRYDIEISNLGNARSTILFELVNENVPSGWEPVTPTEITLQSQAQGGTDTVKTVSFLVSTPYKNGWNNDDTTFQLRITPASTQDVSKTGTPVTVNMLARVRGVYVPTLEPMVMVGAVIGSALLARMMRDDEE